MPVHGYLNYESRNQSDILAFRAKDAAAHSELVHLHSFAIYTHLVIAGDVFLQLIFLAEFQCSTKRKFVAIQGKFSLIFGQIQEKPARGRGR